MFLLLGNVANSACRHGREKRRLELHLPHPLLSPSCWRHDLRSYRHRQPGDFSWDKWTHVAVSMDTSRDESSAEVRLFLDGHRVGFGTCRFNKVSNATGPPNHFPIQPLLHIIWFVNRSHAWQTSQTFPTTRHNCESSVYFHHLCL